MKNTLTLIFAVLLLTVLSSCGKKETEGTTGSKETGKTEQTSENKGGIEINDNTAFHIVYEMGADKKVNIDLYTKGTKARSEAVTVAAGMKMKSVAYFPGDGYVYTVTDIGTGKMGMKMKVTDSDGSDLSQKMFKAKEHLKDFEKDGTGEVIGYQCNIYKDKDGNKYYFYKDYVMLKFEGKGARMTAVKLDTNAKIEDKEFEVPTDVSFKEMDINKYKKK